MNHLMQAQLSNLRVQELRQEAEQLRELKQAQNDRAALLDRLGLGQPARAPLPSRA